jgi:hypothetical protein
MVRRAIGVRPLAAAFAWPRYAAPRAINHPFRLGEELQGGGAPLKKREQARAVQS